MTEYGVVLFPTTSAAIRAEKVAMAAGLKVKLIPTPRQFSSNCGMSLRLGWGEAEAVRQALDDEGVEFHDIKPLN